MNRLTVESVSSKSMLYVVSLFIGYVPTANMVPPIGKSTSSNSTLPVVSPVSLIILKVALMPRSNSPELFVTTPSVRVTSLNESWVFPVNWNDILTRMLVGNPLWVSTAPPLVNERASLTATEAPGTGVLAIQLEVFRVVPGKVSKSRVAGRLPWLAYMAWTWAAVSAESKIATSL